MNELNDKLTYNLLSQITSIPSLLLECGAKNITDKGDYISFSSPFREDKNPSCVLYKQSLVCVDFGGTINGPFSYFFYNCTGISLVKYLQLDYKSFIDETYFNRKTKAEIDQNKIFNSKLKPEFRIIEGKIQYDFSKNELAQNYIKERFLTDDFIKTFQIGYCTLLKAVRAIPEAFKNPNLQYSSFMNRLCIPIYDGSEMISLEGRDLTGKYTKVLYPKGSGSVSSLFNFHNLDKQKPLIVVEGTMDMPRIWQYITTNITTTFGINVTQNQKKQLNEFDHIILFSDTDKAGLEMINSFDKFIEKPFWVARLDQGDPGDPSNSIEDLKKAIENSKESTKFFLDKNELIPKTKIDENYFSN